MAIAYLGLGTNIGDRQQNMMGAVVLLTKRVGRMLALSSLYETEPWGFESEHLFLNAVAVVETHLAPIALLEVTRAIEIEMGRIEKSDHTYKDRVMDIDLLMVDDCVLQTVGLVIPHPLMHQRKFVMKPLVEVAPDVLHPVLGRTMSELLAALE